MKKSIVLLMLWLLAAPVVLRAESSQNKNQLAHLEFLEDQHATVKLENLLTHKMNWKPVLGPLNFGFTPSAFWFRFQLPEALIGQENLVLLFGYATIDDIQLFMPDPSTDSYKISKTGRNYPFSVRSIQTQDLTLEIPLANQLPHHTYYLRIQTQGSAQFPMQIMTFHDYFKHSFSKGLAYRLFMGCMMIMIFYNLIYYLVTRVFSYLVYVSFIICSTLFVMSAYGLTYLYIWPDYPEFNKISIPFFLGLGNCSISVFNLASLRLILQKRLVRNTLYINAALGTGIALACFVIPYAQAVRIAAIQTMFTSVLLPTIYIALCREKYRPAYFFLLSIGSLALGALVFGMKTFGILPHNFLTDSSAMIASASQITLLTFALADQHREIQKKNESMQRDMIEMQQENIRSLDQKVEEKTRDVRVILGSIQQGIFTISGQPPQIDDEFSQHLLSMFPHQRIAGQDPLHLLMDSTQLTGDELEQIRSAMICSLESPLYSFEINENIFPKQLILPNEDQGKRVLQVEWSPVLRKDETVGKILVALRDISRLRELEEQKNRIDADNQLMNLVLSQSQHKVQKFLSFNRSLLERIISHQDASRLDQLKSLLHTLKGNSRTFGLPTVANACHHLEELVKGNQLPRDQMEAAFHAIEQDLLDLERVSAKINSTSLKDQAWIHDKVQASLAQLRAALTVHDSKGPVFVRQAAEGLAALAYRDLEETIQSLIPSIELVAKDLQKPIPELLYQQSTPVYVEHAIAEILQSSMVHILTNSMTHGIETASERSLKEKPVQGRILISQTIVDEWIQLSISDDGYGLRLEKLRQKAVESGLIQAQERDPKLIAETIFTTGISTADQVSLHAGRGVGMTAVRSMLHDMGATIQVHIPQAHDKLLTEYQPFAFIIRLPKARDALLTRVGFEPAVGGFERAS